MVQENGVPCYLDHTADEHYAEQFPEDMGVLTSIEQVERITRRLLGNRYASADVMPTKVMVAMMLMMDRQARARG